MSQNEPYPGIHPSVDLARYAIDEQRIIRKLAQQWYITSHSDEVILGKNSVYRFVLMKPTQMYVEMFNIEREIMCLFSPYTEFQPRTLDAIYEGQKQFQQLRVEPICCIIVSKDSQISDRIADLIKTDPETPVLIPFTYQEMQASYDDYFVRNRMREHFFKRDLFAFESPLKKDLFFFGRSELIQDIVNRNRSNENFALFGLRRSGKTSVVLGIERFLQSQKMPCYIVDCQEPHVHQRNWNEVLFIIANEIKLKYYASAKLHPESSYTEKNASLVFEKDIKSLFKALGRKQIFILFDEIEQISFGTSFSDHWRSGYDFIYFWQTLRSVFQRNQNLISYLIVGTNPSAVERQKFGGIDNPIFHSITYRYLEGFSVQETRQMVRKLGRFMGLKFDEIVYSKLTEDYGGHPFLIRHVCSKINLRAANARPVQVGRGLYEQGSKDFELDSRHYVNLILDVLYQHYPDELEMLKILAHSPQEFNELAVAYPDDVSHLVGYGIVGVDGGRYFFNIDVIRKYLVSTTRSNPAMLSQSERRKEVHEARDNLEISLRRALFMCLQARLGKKKAYNKVLESLGSARQQQQMGYDLAEILGGRSKLYLSDLISIVGKNWSEVAVVFSRSKNRVLGDLEEINETRHKEAHSHEISEEEMAYFRHACNKIQKDLDEFLDC